MTVVEEASPKSIVRSCYRPGPVVEVIYNTCKNAISPSFLSHLFLLHSTNSCNLWQLSLVIILILRLSLYYPFHSLMAAYQDCCDFTFQSVIICHSCSDAVEKQRGIHQNSYQILLPTQSGSLRSDGFCCCWFCSSATLNRHCSSSSMRDILNI